VRVAEEIVAFSATDEIVTVSAADERVAASAAGQLFAIITTETTVSTPIAENMIRSSTEDINRMTASTAIKS